MAGIRPLRSDEKHQSAPLDRVSPPLQIQRGRSAGARPPLRDGVKSDRPRGSVVAPEKNFQYEVFVLAILDQKDTLRRTRTLDGATSRSEATIYMYNRLINT